MRNFLWTQRVLGGQQGAAGSRGLRSRSGTSSLLQLVQQSRQKHLQLLRDDIRNLVNFGDTLAGRAATRGNVYDVQAVEGDTTTSGTAATTATTPDTYAIDAASLRTVVTGTSYTINGSVTGPAAGQARIRVWLGNASTGAKLLDPTYGSETLVSGNLVVELPSGNNTFSLVINLATLPANAATPPSAANPWVITASATSGDDESDPVLVPVTSAATFSVDPSLLKATLASNVITITGTVREPNNVPAVIRVWMGTASGQKLVSPVTFAETIVGSAQVGLAGGTANFSLTANLGALPSGASAPTSTNPWVVTACDQTGGFETSPIIVPSATAAPAPSTAAFTLDATSLKAVLASNIITITGTIQGTKQRDGGAARVDGHGKRREGDIDDLVCRDAGWKHDGSTRERHCEFFAPDQLGRASRRRQCADGIGSVGDHGVRYDRRFRDAACSGTCRDGAVPSSRRICNRSDCAQSRHRKQCCHRIRNRPRPVQHAGCHSDMDGNHQRPEARHCTVVRRDACWRDNGGAIRRSREFLGRNQPRKLTVGSRATNRDSAVGRHRVRSERRLRNRSYPRSDARCHYDRAATGPGDHGSCYRGPEHKRSHLRYQGHDRRECG